MTKRSVSPLANVNWSEMASRAVDTGDFETARGRFEQALALEPNDAGNRFNLALVCDALGDYRVAAEEFTAALLLKPDMRDAARRLGLLLSRHALPAETNLEPDGLKSALQYDLFNRDHIAEAAVYFLARQDPLKSILEKGRVEGWIETARALCLKKTDPLLRSPLFLEALRNNLIRMPDLESLLTAVRRVLLLEVPAERFEDKALLNFTIVLAEQCWTNEFVWSVSEEEEAAVAEKSKSAGRALEGSVSAAIDVLRAALYIPFPSLVPDATPLDRVKAIRPQAVRDFLYPLIEQHREERRIVTALPELAPVKDQTSLQVAAQYGDYPYPRWTSLGYLLRPGEWRKSMADHFSADRLAFMDEPFEVLIAGCGTGVQAIAAARAYGPNAKVTAIDISKPSLGYAARMAKHFQAENITFVSADILDLANAKEYASRFRVVESVGVLHHMADPFAGWRALLSTMHPEGMMLIGLYSEIARRRWMAMRDDPAYPGAGCDDRALRRFRADLLQRPDSELGSEFKGIRDLYTTSSFRDLMLHVSERRHSIPELGDFLNDNGLRFRGFTKTEDFHRLQETYPDEEWPGTLAHWADYESANPTTFANMYRFWSDRA
jgi:SAM-dependent methyltransferase/tetratricopeptide (TPR) repeat protein